MQCAAGTARGHRLLRAGSMPGLIYRQHTSKIDVNETYLDREDVEAVVMVRVECVKWVWVSEIYLVVQKPVIARFWWYAQDS